jgi:hypothetical protein
LSQKKVDLRLKFYPFSQKSTSESAASLGPTPFSNWITYPSERLASTFGRKTPGMVVFDHPYRPDAASSDCGSAGWHLARSVL